MNALTLICAEMESGAAASELERDELGEFVDFCQAVIAGTESYFLPDDPAPRVLNCRETMDIIRDVAQIYR
ncbi:MAG TPA: hypothetical protein VJL59_14200 [Anaerolineales bacterium]|nr:hypothetical protein [Anaerolineales bacterium]HLB48155.1 hypothetical protein [Anaerolineales bacterium]